MAENRIAIYANKHTLVICRKTADFSRKYQRSIVCCIVLVILDTCDSWLISLHHSCIHLDTPSRKSDVLKIQHSLAIRTITITLTIYDDLLHVTV